MSVTDIFQQMASHMIEGMMVHEQLMNSYLFLSLPGYAEMHKYHYLSESIGYIRLCEYISDHYEMAVPSGRPSDPGIIPTSWKDASKDSITPKIRREAMEGGLHDWIDWETDTVKLYSKLYEELLTMQEVPASEFVKKYALDAEEEIVYARQELLHKQAMDFDPTFIYEEQPTLVKLFRHKIKKIGGQAYENE